MNEKNIGKPINFKIIKRSVGTVIINGVPHADEQLILQLTCPNCGGVLSETSDLSALRSLYSYEEQNIFCMKCGQKIILEKGDVIENE